ncbi:MAG: S1C family serine protease [Ferruginibacter sp.]
MDDILLLEAIERYTNGEMSSEDKAYFENLRKTNPEIDQLVVENSFFLHNVESFSNQKLLKHSIAEIEQKLTDEGVIKVPSLKGKAKVISLWNKYKRNIAVAASIAGFISLLTTGLMITYTKKIGNENIELLVKKLNETNREVNKLKTNQVNSTSTNPAPKVDYRATGFIIDGKGFLITNAHVISKMKNIYVENKKGSYFKAEAVYTDIASDLAVLQITDTAFKAIVDIPYSIKKGNADLGDQFFTLGFPRNEIVYGEGYLSAKTGNDGDSTAYQLTVSANPGNSGGPVVNKYGEIIGIITAKDADADGVVYAAKSKNIFSLIEKLKKSDDRFQSIKTPTNTGLKGLDRVQQVKKMEEYVYMVVGN